MGLVESEIKEKRSPGKVEDTRERFREVCLIEQEGPPWIASQLIKPGSVNCATECLTRGSMQDNKFIITAQNISSLACVRRISR